MTHDERKSRWHAQDANAADESPGTGSHWLTHALVACLTPLLNQVLSRLDRQIAQNAETLAAIDRLTSMQETLALAIAEAADGDVGASDEMPATDLAGRAIRRS